MQQQQPRHSGSAVGDTALVGLNVALAHGSLALILQLGNYVAYLAGRGATAELAWPSLVLLPLAQFPTLVVAALLGLLAGLAHGSRVGRMATFALAGACNALLVMDQRVYAVFFDHFRFDLVDGAAWSWFATRLVGSADTMLFVGMAALTAVTAWTQRALWGPPRGSTARGLGRLGRAFPAPVGVALTVALVAAMAIVSAAADLRGLNQHPLALWIEAELLRPQAVAVHRPQVNVAAPRYSVSSPSADPLTGGDIAGRLADFGGARPNLVLVRVGGSAQPGGDGRPGPESLSESLLHQAVVLDQIHYSSSAAGALGASLEEYLAGQGYGTARFAASATRGSAGRAFSGGVCDFPQDHSAVQAWLAQRRQEGLSVALFVNLSDKELGACPQSQTGGQALAAAPLVDALMRLFRDGGLYHQTVFAFVTEPESSNAAQPNTLTVVVPDRLEDTLHSHRVGAAEDVAATLVRLLGLAPATGRDLLAPQFQDRNVFWVEEDTLLRWGVRDGDWLYQGSAWGTDQQLYNMAMDPHRGSNLATLLPRQAALYHRLCATWFAHEGHLAVADKSAFAWNGRGWWLPKDLGMPGPKRVDFGLSGERPVARNTAPPRFHPYAPLIAQVSLLPAGRQLDLSFEWFGPAGHQDTLQFRVDGTWNSTWIVPGFGLPMAPGLWTLRVREEGILRLAAEFVVDQNAPQARPWASVPRALLAMSPGVYVSQPGAHQARIFEARERFVPGEVPVVDTRWAPGPGMHRLTFRWRSPSGETYARETGMREEWEQFWLELDKPPQPWARGSWELTLQEGEVTLGTLTLHMDGEAQP